MLDSILKWFDQHIASYVLNFYTNYHAIYYILALLAGNALLLIYLNPINSYSSTLKNNFFITYLSSIALFLLASLWFRDLNIIKYQPLLFGVKLGSIGAAIFFLYTEYSLYKIGTKAVDLSFIMSLFVSFAIFLVITIIGTIIGYILDRV